MTMPDAGEQAARNRFSIIARDTSVRDRRVYILQKFLAAVTHVPYSFPRLDRVNYDKTSGKFDRPAAAVLPAGNSLNRSKRKIESRAPKYAFTSRGLNPASLRNAKLDFRDWQNLNFVVAVAHACRTSCECISSEFIYQFINQVFSLLRLIVLREAGFNGTE